MTQIYYTKVTSIGVEDNCRWWFDMEGLGSRWWNTHDPGLRPGDRVKITITKEPVDEHA